MADIRINALATTATTPASDDYLALDGAAQGTRKILATNIANNVTDVILGSSGPSVKSSLSARAPRQGAQFNGTLGGTVAFPAPGTGDYTYAFWINPTNFSVTRYLLGANTGPTVAIFVNTAGQIGINNLSTGNLTGTASLTAGKWQLVTLRRTGTSLYIGINGIEEAAITDSRNYTVATAVWGASSASGVNDPWLGGLSGPYAYNRALSASEVVALYEAGAPKGTDYNTASNTSVITGSFYNNSLNSFSGASSTGFTATCTSSVGYAAVSLATPYPTVGQKVRVSITLSATTATLYAWLHIGGYGPGDATGSAVLLTAGTTNVIEYTINSTYAPNGTNTLCIGTLNGSSNGATFTVSNAAVYRAGLLLAPDAAQAGGGLVWYDTSGNAANITLPASGVSWNVPSSRYLGGNWTTSGTLSATGSQTADTVPYNLLAGGNKRIYIGYNTTGDYGALNVADTGVAWKNLVVNQNGGNVLIGQTSDSGQKLQVNGTALISGNLTVSGGTVTNSPASGGPLFKATRPANTASAAFASIPNGALSGSNVEWYAGLYGNSGQYRIWAFNGSADLLSLNLTESGNVLIGTTTDGGQKLQVSGTALIDSGASPAFYNNINASAQSLFHIAVQRSGSSKAYIGLDSSDNFSLFASNATKIASFSNSDLSATFAGKATGTQFVATGGAAAAGSIWAASSAGFIVQAKTGSVQDFVITNPGATQNVLEVPTGTLNATFGGSIKTAAPSGGTANTWKLGTVATVSPTSPNRTIEVDIGGTIYYIHAKTTNN